MEYIKSNRMIEYSAPERASRRELSQQEQPEGFYANKRVAQAGGSVAGNAQRDLEQRLGRPVITSANAAQLNHVVTQMIEASASAAADITDEKE